MVGSTKKVFSANLDLLRGVAVLCVYVSHLLVALHHRSLGSLGRFGVILFFVHTSFVLMGSLERLDRTAESRTRLAIGFWVRRAFRIYPLAMLFVVLAVVAHVPSSPELTYRWVGAKAFVSNLLLTQNLTYSPDVLGPLWSLPLEVQMYVLLPLVYLVVRGRARYRSLALWCLAVGLALTLPRLSWRLSMFLYAPCFTSGVVAYDLKRSWAWRGRLPGWMWPVGILVAIATFRPHDNVSMGDKIALVWAVSLGIGVLYACVREISVPRVQPTLTWIAEHSYGVYLSHIVVFWLVFDVMGGAPVWARVAVLVAGSVGVPAVLYRTVEKPLIGVGARVAGRVLRLHDERRERWMAYRASGRARYGVGDGLDSHREGLRAALEVGEPEEVEVPGSGDARGVFSEG